MGPKICLGGLVLRVSRGPGRELTDVKRVRPAGRHDDYCPRIFRCVRTELADRLSAERFNLHHS